MPFKNSPELPSDVKIQSFLNDLIKDLIFKDSIIINFLDPDHTFRYVMTPTQLVAPKLVGRHAVDFRPKSEIGKLSRLLERDQISLFVPIDFQEGWAGLPFNFITKNASGGIIAYVAPVLNLKYLLNYFYNPPAREEFIHRFVINDSIDITREAVYDSTPILNENRDSLYFKYINVPKKIIYLFG